MNKLIILFALVIAVLVTSCEPPNFDIRTFQIVGYSDAEYAEITQVLDLPRIPDNYKGASSLQNATAATLGRVLFYDPQLSEDMTVSCASCHRQENAFADPVAKSAGIYGRLTDRNSISLGSFASFEAEYGEQNGSLPASRSLFWDMRANSLHSQMIETIANDLEMGMHMSEIVHRIKDQRHYQILFDKAFLSPQITEESILNALEAFMKAMTADQTHFDEAFAQSGLNLFAIKDAIKDFPDFTQQENLGKQLFIDHCGACHSGNLVHNSTNNLVIANNGLDAGSTDDLGVGGASGVPEEVGHFKIPFLRNIALTGPYMHDGRFETLAEVIDFYSEGIQPHPNLSPELSNRDGVPVQMDFNQSEKDAIVAFLHTLTDVGEIGQPKFADPWK